MAKGRIPESDIAAIRERTPIEDIVGEYVQLKPAGVDSLKGLSPFRTRRHHHFMCGPTVATFTASPPGRAAMCSVF